jgi:hypothetical protein
VPSNRVMRQRLWRWRVLVLLGFVFEQSLSTRRWYLKHVPAHLVQGRPSYVNGPYRWRHEVVDYAANKFNVEIPAEVE